MNPSNIFFFVRIIKLIIILVFLSVILVSCFQDSTPASKEPYMAGVTYLNYQVNTVYDQSCSQTNFNSSYDASGLKITEVSYYWIELMNTNQVGGSAVCLNNYQLRSSQKTETPLRFDKYALPNIKIPPQSYFIIRFYGNAQNDSSSIIIRTALGMYLKNNHRVGLFDLIKINPTTSREETVDFVRLCTDSLGNSPGNPTTGTFTGCLSFPISQYQYGSFSLNESLTDNDTAMNWTYRNVVTFGGKNDVTTVTDADNDGIPDANEQPGTTFAGMPMYDWGARDGNRDIFVHIAYMDGEDYLYNNVLVKEGLTPFKESFEHIRRVFSSNGYHIHFDLGGKYSATVDPLHFNLSGQTHEVPYSEYVDIKENAVNGNETPDAVSVILYKNRFMPVNRLGIFHFGLIANAYSFGGVRTSVQGTAELPGNDFLIFTGSASIQNYSDVAKHNYLATIVMHELGHNLNLRHGGDNDENNNPNYFSIMNYGYIYNGVPKTNDSSMENFLNRYLSWSERHTNDMRTITNTFDSTSFNMNFSHGLMPNLDENSLSEVNPLGPGIGNVDWNMDGVIVTNLALDINNSVNRSILSDYNDWNNLQLPFDRSISSAGNDGYDNLPLAHGSHTHDVDGVALETIPRGSALVSEEGKSFYSIDKFPLLLDPGQ